MPTADAGSGAEQKARRAAAREAELEGQLERLRRTRASWEAGAAGERAVGAELECLPADGWRVLHDVHWPGRPQANIDHVVVGPGGVVLVDAKNWTGSVTIRDGVLRQNGYRRENVQQSAGAAAAAVTALLAPGHRSCLTTVVCFVQHPLAPVVVPPGVLVVGLAHVSAWLRALPPVLSAQEVAAIHGYLARELTGPRSPQQATTRTLASAASPPVREPSAAARRSATRRRYVPRSIPAVPVPTRSGPPFPPARSGQVSGAAVLKAVAVAVVLLTIVGWAGSLGG